MIEDKINEYISISCEDNMELMARYPDNYFDLAIVDPPYGHGNKETGILNFRMKDQEKQWNIAPNNEYFDELFRVSENQIIWGGNYFPYIWNFGGRCFVYWHKGNPVPNFADGELAWTSFNKNAKQFNYRYYGNLEGNGTSEQKIHATQKPIALYRWLFTEYANNGYKILDTHIGSGSIAIGLDSVNKIEKMNLALVGCEIDKEQYGRTIERIKAKTSWQSLI